MGVGLLQVLVLFCCCWPFVQRPWHSLHGPHDDQPPFTGKRMTKMNNCYFIIALFSSSSSLHSAEESGFRLYFMRQWHSDWKCEVRKMRSPYGHLRRHYQQHAKSRSRARWKLCCNPNNWITTSLEQLDYPAFKFDKILLFNHQLWPTNKRS